MKIRAKHVVAWLAVIIFNGLSGKVCGQASISGVVNQYASVQAISGSNKLIVDAPLTFAMNDRVLIIQMQGATIDESNNPTFGSITDTGSAGLYEYNSVCGINGDTLVLEFELANTYSIPGNVQVVQVPHYTDAIVTGTLTALPWNDSTGGILAIDVTGTLTLSSYIDATGLGFRGGDYTPAPPTCNWWSSYPNFYYSSGSANGLTKGQGIASIITGKELGKGPQGNGGGGGNNHNAGGGGGANAGAGGKGGDNNEPGSFNCHGFNPGLGGVPVSPNPNRFFFGGGGGSGHGNNMDPGTISSGGAGGGIIIIRADSIIGNGYQITAAGAVGGYASNDGAGGGGAGGTVILDVNGYHPSSLTIDVSGGDGGDADNDGVNRCYGPGGGGGGGVVFGSISLPGQVTVVATGGVCGESINSNTCAGPQNAENGEYGITQSGTSMVESNVPGIGCATLLPIIGLELWVEGSASSQCLRWKLFSPENIAQFEIQCRTSAQDLSILGNVEAQTNWNTVYKFPLPQFGPGKYYLRLRTLSNDGDVDHSHWVLWRNKGEIPVCGITPTLVTTTSEAFVRLDNFDQKSIIEVFNASGKTIQVISTNGPASVPLTLLNPGIYFVRVTGGAQVCQSRLIVQP